MELTFAAATDVGRQRQHNEDNFLIDKKLRLFVVADGMGGHAAGEVASSMAVHEIRNAVFKNRDLIERYGAAAGGSDSIEILQMLEHAIQSACSTVYNQAQADPSQRGMGTTATVLLVAGSPDHLRGFVAHVGDSRCYLVRQQQCHVLTEDHSLVNELLRRGKLTREQIQQAPYQQYKNAVTRAVGVYGSVDADTLDFDLLPGDALLLCSDGLHAYFENSALPRLLTDGDLQQVPQALVEMANQGGGHDNITAVVVRVSHEAAGDIATSGASLKLEVLRGLHLFRFLTYKELVRVSSIAQAMDAAAGEQIFQEDQPGDSMFVIMSGEVRMSKANRELAVLGKGDHFGEMSLVDQTIRSLTATAVSPARLLSIKRPEFYDIIKKEPELAVKLLWSFIQVLSDRLRKTTSDLSDVLSGSDERPGDQGGQEPALAPLFPR
jgi:serine/threonine protein phosphatase PrpC